MKKNYFLSTIKSESTMEPEREQEREREEFYSVGEDALFLILNAIEWDDYEAFDSVVDLYKDYIKQIKNPKIDELIEIREFIKSVLAPTTMESEVKSEIEKVISELPDETPIPTRFEVTDDDAMNLPSQLLDSFTRINRDTGEITPSNPMSKYGDPSRYGQKSEISLPHESSDLEVIRRAVGEKRDDVIVYLAEKGVNYNAFVVPSHPRSYRRTLYN